MPAEVKKKATQPSPPVDDIARLERDEWPETLVSLQQAFGVDVTEQISELYSIGQRWADGVLTGATELREAYQLANLARHLLDKGEGRGCLHYWRAMAYHKRDQPAVAADALLAAPDSVQMAYSNELIGLLRDAGRPEEARRVLKRLTEER